VASKQSWQRLAFGLLGLVMAAQLGLTVWLVQKEQEERATNEEFRKDVSRRLQRIKPLGILEELQNKEDELLDP
jgi:hypothetical protein